MNEIWEKRKRKKEMEMVGECKKECKRKEGRRGQETKQKKERKNWAWLAMIALRDGESSSQWGDTARMHAQHLPWRRA